MEDDIKDEFNLASLLNPRFSTSSEGVAFEWTCSHCTKGHFIVIIIAMILTYVVQLLSFVICLAYLKPDLIQYHQSAALTQPYFECFQLFVLSFIVHFQFHAFYLEPFKILNLISKHLHYTNITATILTSSILISIDYESNHFNQIYQMNTLILLLILITYSYTALSTYIQTTKNSRFRQILGFNILYSLTLPLIIIELGESIFRVSSFYNKLFLSESSRVILFTTLYFSLGSSSLFLTSDVYLGLSFALNLLGTCAVQSYNICKDFENYCSTTASALSGTFSMLTIFECLFIFYRFPRVYCFDYSVRRF
jgi:hypothetical protein